MTNEILAKEELANDIDKKAALLGLKCHKRGIEPYFPSTAFFSGNAYDYSASKENANVDTDNSNVTNNTKFPGNTKEKKHSKDTKLIRNGKINKSNLYECTDDCKGATDEDCNLFKNILHTFSNADNKTIRNVLDEYDYCSNEQREDIYLLPCKKRNHPRVCYEKGCKSFSVLIRKLAIHHKNGRRIMNIANDLNIAHKFIHDIDVATVLGDIDYLIKLVAFQRNKQPSVFSSSEMTPIDFENQKHSYDRLIAKYKRDCLNLPDIVCQSCNILECKTNIQIYVHQILCA